MPGQLGSTAPRLAQHSLSITSLALPARGLLFDDKQPA
jgi:hypothetical protein